MGVTLIPHPLALPGCCFKCRVGSENREWFIDFDFSMDDFGAIIICNECVWEMAHAAGMVTAKEAESLKNTVRQFIKINEDLETKLFGLEQAIDGLRIAGSVPWADSERTPVISDDSTEQDVPVESGELDEGTGSTPEPLHDERVAVVSDDADSHAGTFKLGL